MTRIVYAGTPEFAVPALEALCASGYEVVGVYTQPDRPAGRGRKLQPSAVKVAAQTLGIPIYQPENFKDCDAVEELRQLKADLMIVAAYGIILPREVLEIPVSGCINIHASLLPRWRGAAPIQRAILAGDKNTGITIMQMNEGLDTGDMLSQSAIEISPEWTSAELHDVLSFLGGDLLIETLSELDYKQASAVKQDNDYSTYADRLSKAEALIDWHKPAAALSIECRAFVPWPISHTTLQGESVRIWLSEATETPASGRPGDIVEHNKQGVFVSTGDFLLKITELQMPGKNRCQANQLLNSHNFKGSCFGS